MTTEYRPIGCDAHSVLELLALRRVAAELRVVDPQGRPLTVAGRIVDVFTRDGAEYLRVLGEDGSGVDLRLDRLRLIASSDGRVLWRQETDTPR